MHKINTLSTNIIQEQVNQFRHKNVVTFFTNNIFKIGFILHSIENHFDANYFCYVLLDKTYPKTKPLIVVLTRSHCGYDFSMYLEEKNDWNINDILTNFYNYFSSLQFSQLDDIAKNANNYNTINKNDIVKKLYDIN